MNQCQRPLRLKQATEKLSVTPANAGVQDIRVNETSNRLDSGFRRNDDVISSFFHKLVSSHADHYRPYRSNEERTIKINTSTCTNMIGSGT